jgi:hypothetical protein
VLTGVLGLFGANIATSCFAPEHQNTHRWARVQLHVSVSKHQGMQVWSSVPASRKSCRRPVTVDDISHQTSLTRQYLRRAPRLRFKEIPPYVSSIFQYHELIARFEVSQPESIGQSVVHSVATPPAPRAKHRIHPARI